ncbi:unnamed protein product [Miscanthus lutarioriparius]|uniref:Dirigent protein n=1 Tax=Miscanthus lutarioriparius TaxID=422564 RepID=A0A811MY87_9POAL|nr:unnamed protein product [Miscanthus lutarioriparius]
MATPPLTLLFLFLCPAIVLAIASPAEKTGPNPNETIVARAQGFHLQAGQTATSWYTSQIIVFQDDSSFAGSTLEVLGITLPPRPSGGQWSIMGGTGTFTNAHGNIKYNDVQSTESSITDVVKELDIDIFYTPEIST